MQCHTASEAGEATRSGRERGGGEGTKEELRTSQEELRKECRTGLRTKSRTLRRKEGRTSEKKTKPRLQLIATDLSRLLY